MPVFRPDAAHLAAQIRSIAEQSIAPDLVVFVVADGQSGGLIGQFAQAAGLRHALAEPPDELDAPRAVEAGLARALALTGPDTLIALADQDDLWHPQRLAAGVAALAASPAALAHADARLVDAGGALLHPSMWRFEGRLRRPGLRGLLLRNTVTGMTVLMRRRVAELALPFPPQAGVHFFHDLWLALVAEATGGIAEIDRPLVDYRQHGANAVGAVDGRRRPRLGWPRRATLRREAAAYALARHLAHSLHNRLADAVADGRLRHGEARIDALRPYLRHLRGAGAHLADALALALRGHRDLGRLALGHGLVSLGRSVWALREALGPGLRAATDRFDERLFALSPGVLPVPPRAALPIAVPRPVAAVVDGRKTARFRPRFDAPGPALNVLVPTLNPPEIFAGIATAIGIGTGLAARGLPVRFIATDLPVSAGTTARRFVLSTLPAAERAAADPHIGLACGQTTAEIAGHPDDVFLATAWWTAHLAAGLIDAHGYRSRRFLYLLQDYEPQFYPWGPEQADAEASYALDFEPVFNTTLLRDYFAAQGHRFAGRGALCFQPAIDVARYAGRPRPPRRGPRRLALYGRPEVPRNMFATAIEATDRFLRDRRLGPDDIEVLSVGLRHAPVQLSGGVVVQSLGKLPFEDYPDWLAGIDLGLSLMQSPHPSHPPIEMAAAGARVVTNRFAAKDLSALSPAILSCAATPAALAAGLAAAWDMPPPAEADRRIDLSPLGEPLVRVTDRLADRLRPLLAPLERAA
jgi:hypothetical protein